MKPIFEEFFEEENIPEICKKCEIANKIQEKGVKDFKIYGWRAGSPIGYARIEGCNLNIPCIGKKYTLISWGIRSRVKFLTNLYVHLKTFLQASRNLQIKPGIF